MHSPWCQLRSAKMITYIIRTSGFQVVESWKRQHICVLACVFSSLWSHVLHWLGISSVSSSDIRQHFIQFTTMAGLPRFTHSFLRVIWFASVWVLWKERNNRVFQNTTFQFFYPCRTHFYG